MTRGGLADTDVAVRNDGTDTVYVSADPEIVKGDDGVVSIPAGGSAVVSSTKGKLYFTETGSAFVMATDSSANTFKTSAQSGGSGADDVARTAINDHSGNTEIRVTVTEKTVWNAKANKSGIPTSLPARWKCRHS